MKHRILIAEEHELLRLGLRSMIGALPDFEVVADTRDGKDAVRETMQLQPAMVLLNFALPGMSGIEVTAQVKRRLPQVRVVVMTPHKSDEHVRDTLRAGVDGYLLKDASYDELLMALRSVMSGKTYLSPDVSGHLVDTFLNGHKRGARVSPWERLTTRERSILKLVAEGHTNRGAAVFLSVSPKTVEKHRASLMRKLGLRNHAELTLVALESGLIERPGTVSRLMGRFPQRDEAPQLGGAGVSSERGAAGAAGGGAHDATAANGGGVTCAPGELGLGNLDQPTLPVAAVPQVIPLGG